MASFLQLPHESDSLAYLLDLLKINLESQLVSFFTFTLFVWFSVLPRNFSKFFDFKLQLALVVHLWRTNKLSELVLVKRLALILEVLEDDGL